MVHSSSLSRTRATESHLSVFERLGRVTTRHPWYVILCWILIVFACLPAVAGLSGVLASSGSTGLPNSAPSVVAQNHLSELFPGEAAPPSSSIILLTGPNIVGTVGQNATVAVQRAIETDTNLRYLGPVESIYSAYGTYLTAEAQVGLQVLSQSVHGAPSLTVSLNSTASFVWAPASAYVTAWDEIASQLPPGAPPADANWPAFSQTREQLNPSSQGEQILNVFYNGYNSSIPGFNQTVTPGCLDSHNLTPCADASMDSTFPPLLPSLEPDPANRTLPMLVLSGLGVENWSTWSSLQRVGSAFLGSVDDLSADWLYDLWTTFPALGASNSTLAVWASDLATFTPVDRWPLPPPAPLESGFVSPSGNATLILVSFTQSDSYKENGSIPVYQDVSEINSRVSSILGSNLAWSSIGFYQTGPAAIDAATNDLVTSTLGLLLILTIVTLVVITIVYFRALAAPAVSFATIGIALIVSLAFVFLIGKYVASVQSAVEAILLILLLSIGTDYSIFMMARYREELVAGRVPSEAVVTAVRWAGQSIVTSGLTVVAVGIALTLSGVSFQSQLGLAVALGVSVEIVAAVTLLPAILSLMGPRVFWPYTGERFRRYAEERKARVDSGRTYFSRAGKVVTRRPLLTIVVILLLSLPFAILAFQVPVSYDVTNTGLPSSQSAQAGLNELQNQFGSGYLSSSFVLVTFVEPLFPASGSPNAVELEEVGDLARTMSSVSGISSVSSLVGSGGATVGQWLNLSSAPLGERVLLESALTSFVGSDGQTVRFQVTTNASGTSSSGASAFGTLESSVSSFQRSHPEITTIYYGGSAQSTRDLQAQTNGATDGMLIGVTIGIFVILTILLGALVLPAFALGAIGLSILWAWSSVYLVVGVLEGEALIFILPMALLVLILGLGMDYNALFLTRVREERLRGARPDQAIQRALTHTGGVITAAAVILGGAFFILGLTSPLGLLAGLGLGIGIATFLQAFVAQTYLMPAILAGGKDRVWWGPRRNRPSEAQSTPADN